MGRNLIFFIFCILLFGCDSSGQHKVAPVKDIRNDVCGMTVDFLKQEEATISADINTVDKYITPTIKLSPGEWPNLIDDLDFNGIELAIARQIKRFNSLNLNRVIKLGNEEYKLLSAKKSLEKFSKLIAEYKSCVAGSRPNCQSIFNANMMKDFNAYVPKLEPGDPRYNEDKPVLFTAYYTPALLAQPTPTARFKYPVYALPHDNKKKANSRVQIDFKSALKNDNLELHYTDDLFNLYLMHVQGGGRIRVLRRNGEVSQYVSFAGTNGLPWNFISKYMLQNKMISDGSIAAQRNFLLQNPNRQEEIYASCPSYVYFKKTYHPPEGSDSVSLTDNRSIATDTNYYKFKGLLAFVMAERPEEEQIKGANCRGTKFRPYSRFYLDQDTGGAIRGKGRVDLYFGEGDYAERTAYNLVRRGSLYFFMLK